MKRIYSALPLCFFYLVITAQSAHNDCNTAVWLCDKSTYQVQYLDGPGSRVDEVANLSCHDTIFPESNSIWVKWTVERSGSLAFTIMPVEESDDIDFVLFKSSNQSNDCAGSEEVRCMAAGPRFGENRGNDYNCTGAVGLNFDATQTSVGSGCEHGSDNFLAGINVLAGEVYMLFINNFQSNRGFMLEFAGDCTFESGLNPCPQGQFPSIQNFEEKFLHISTPAPNPAHEEVTLVMNASNNMDGVIMLIDVRGNILQTAQVTLSQGSNMYRIPVAQLHTGVYFIKMRFGDKVYLSRIYRG